MNLNDRNKYNNYFKIGIKLLIIYILISILSSLFVLVNNNNDDIYLDVNEIEGEIEKVGNNKLDEHQKQRLMSLMNNDKWKKTQPLILCIVNDEYIDDNNLKLIEFKNEAIEHNFDFILLNIDNDNHKQYIPNYLNNKEITLQVFNSDNSISINNLATPQDYGFYIVEDNNIDIALQTHKDLSLKEFLNILNNY